MNLRTENMRLGQRGVQNCICWFGLQFAVCMTFVVGSAFGQIDLPTPTKNVSVPQFRLIQSIEFVGQPNSRPAFALTSDNSSALVAIQGTDWDETWDPGWTRTFPALCKRWSCESIFDRKKCSAIDFAKKLSSSRIEQFRIASGNNSGMFPVPISQNFCGEDGHPTDYNPRLVIAPGARALATAEGIYRDLEYPFSGYRFMRFPQCEFERDVRNVEFNSDGTLAAVSCARDGVARSSVDIIETGSGRSLGHVQFADKVNDVRFNLNYTLFAAALDDGTVEVQSISDHTLVATITDKTGKPVKVGFGPNNELFLVTSPFAHGGDCKLAKWDFRNSQKLAVTSLFDYVDQGGRSTAAPPFCDYFFQFSPSGLILVTGSTGIRLWDLQHIGQSIALYEHQDQENAWLSGIEFSPDGKYIGATFSHRDVGLLRVWRAVP